VRDVPTSVNNGTQITMLGVNDAGDWYYTNVTGITGWISETLVSSNAATPEGCLSSLPRLDDNGYPLPTPTPTATPNPSLCTGYGIEGPVNVRSGPSKDDAVLYSFGVGGNVNELQVLGRYLSSTDAPIDDWLRVTSTNGDGWASAMWTRLEGSCFPMTIVNAEGTSTGQVWSPENVTLQYSLQAAELYSHSDYFRLPAPFSSIPIAFDNYTWSQGYGPNTYSFENQSFYTATHGYHSGLDFGGNEPSIPSFSSCLGGNGIMYCVEAIAVCDGIIVEGRSSNGGSTAPPRTGLGLSIRCALSDGSLSNIIVVYNH
jgi:hypothetical protein